jgi:hypothetical protein
MATPSLYRSFDRSKLLDLNNPFFKKINILFLEVKYLEFQLKDFHLNFYIFRICVSKKKIGYVMFTGFLFFYNSQILGSSNDL